MSSQSVLKGAAFGAEFDACHAAYRKRSGGEASRQARTRTLKLAEARHQAENAQAEFARKRAALHLGAGYLYFHGSRGLRRRAAAAGRFDIQNRRRNGGVERIGTQARVADARDARKDVHVELGQKFAHDARSRDAHDIEARIAARVDRGQVVDAVFLRTCRLGASRAGDAARCETSLHTRGIGAVGEGKQNRRARGAAVFQARKHGDGRRFVGAAVRAGPSRHIDVDGSLMHMQARRNAFDDGGQRGALRISGYFVVHHAPNVLVFFAPIVACGNRRRFRAREVAPNVRDERLS